MLTDHFNLQRFMTSSHKIINCRQIRWIKLLVRYNFEIRHQTNKNNLVNKSFRKSDYIRNDDTLFLSILQRKLKYERRLAEDNSHEMKKSENILMKNIIKNNSRSSISDDQSRKIVLTESHDHDEKEAWEYQETSVTDTKVIQAMNMFEFRNQIDTDELMHFMSHLWAIRLAWNEITYELFTENLLSLVK